MSQERLRIVLNGTTLRPNEYDGSKGAKITLRQDENGEARTSFGSDLRLLGERARTIIFDNLINAANPLLASVPILIYDTCCKDIQGNDKLLFEGIIRFGDVKYCEVKQDGTCEMNIEFQDDSTLAKQLQCLKSIFINSKESPDGSITSLGEDEAKAAIYYDYYEETRPKAYMYVLLYLTMFVVNLITPFLIALTILSLGFFRPRRAIQAIYDSFLKRRLHKAPFIYSYLKNACKLCGLNLSSSLFDIGGTYHLLTRMDCATQEGGKDKANADSIYNLYNAPLITPIELLQSFRDLNIRWGIDTQNNLLIVERKDYFSNNVWVDFTAGRAEDIVSLCYEFSGELQPIGAVYKHTSDLSDKTGNESLRNWSGLADWNTPYNPNLQGYDNRTIQYGTSRFVDDELDSVIYNFSRSVLFQIGTFGGLLFSIDYIMIMSSGTAFAPKLLMWDSQSNQVGARVQKLQNPFGGGSQYNIPARLNVSNVNGDTFYHNLLEIDNPQNNLLKNQAYTLIYSYICEDINNFSFGKTVKFFRDSVPVLGTVETVEIDLDKFQMTITGKI